MKIVYLFMKYPMGVQPYAISDIRALEGLGHTVDVYALSTPSADHDEAMAAYGLRLNPGAQMGWRTLLAPFDPRNLAITAFLLGSILPRLLRRPKELAVALLLAPRMVEVTATLRRDPPDVMHAFWGHYPSLMLALAERFSPKTHRSLALTAYDITSHLFSLSGAIAQRCDSVWTLADENVPLLRAIGAPMDRARVVYRGVPIDLAERVTVEKQRGLICTAANFQKEKNIDLVLRAFAAAHRAAPHLRLLVMGDGQERENLTALARELGIDAVTTFTGLLPRQQLFETMAGSEIFLFLSTKVSERLPNVVMEAMLARCVCVVSRTSGIETLIEQGASGFIEDDLDPERVAARLLTALDDPDRAEIGARASAHIHAKFSARAAMSAYAEVWRHGPGAWRAGPTA